MIPTPSFYRSCVKVGSQFEIESIPSANGFTSISRLLGETIVLRAIEAKRRNTATSFREDLRDLKASNFLREKLTRVLETLE